jgi:hypothetical protein
VAGADHYLDVVNRDHTAECRVADAPHALSATVKVGGGKIVGILADITNGCCRGYRVDVPESEIPE